MFLQPYKRDFTFCYELYLKLKARSYTSFHLNIVLRFSLANFLKV